MIHIEQQGSVTAIRMARSIFGRPLAWTAAYWVDGLLIDAGPYCAADDLLKVLQKVEVEQIVLTHGHEEQIGGLAKLRDRYPDVSIYASPRTLNSIEHPQTLKIHLYRRLMWGTPQPVKDVISVEKVDNVISTSHFTFRVVETPGHCIDHITLYEPNQRWAFCGDAFIAGRDEAWPPEFDMFSIIGSLRTIASLRPERLFPGSGNIRRTPRPEIYEKISYLTRLCQEVAALESVGLSVPEIATCLFKEEPRITFWTRGHYSSTHLVRACSAYNEIFAPLEEGSGGGMQQESEGNSRKKRSSNSKDTSANNPADAKDREP